MLGLAIGTAVTARLRPCPRLGLAVPVGGLLAGVGASLLVGAVAGLYPAARASRLAPAEPSARPEAAQASPAGTGHARHGPATPAPGGRAGQGRKAPRAGCRRGHRARFPAMRFGITMFPTDRSIGIVELAREAEARGFDSLWVPEHTHIPASRGSPVAGRRRPPEQYWRCLDPIVAMTAAAMATERLRVGTGILLAAQREPIANAKAIATLDHVPAAGCRWASATAGTARRWPTTAWPTASAGEVAREHVLAMQALWRDDEAEFHGTYVDFAPSRSWPKPVQRDGEGRPSVPVLVGGGAAQAVRPGGGVRRRRIPIGGAGIGSALSPSCASGGRGRPRPAGAPGRCRSGPSRPSASSTTTPPWA